MLQVDIPYLEPLWLWLRADETLKQHFTEHSFFMPHSHLVSATEEAMRKDCPAPRALWILPGDSIASQTARVPPGCSISSSHTFYIQIIVQCIRDAFQAVEREGSLALEGQFMELSFLRNKVKQSVLKFSSQWRGKEFENVQWRKDSILYPTEESNFLATASEFNVTIF